MLQGDRGKMDAASKSRMGHVVLVLTCFIVAYSNRVSAGFTALTQESPVVVAVGDVALITCRTSIIRELVEVRWIRSHAGHRYIISLFQDGRDQQRCDLPEYVGRTELVKEGLARGRATLKLFNVAVADEGAYHCFLETADYFDIGDLELRVTALGSHPRIDIEGFQDGGIKVVCRSEGWYPEPTLVNKDHDGEMTSQQEENGLYNIEYSRIITENSNRTFSCRLWTSFHSPDLETSIYVADALFRKCADPLALIVLSSIALVLVAAAAAGTFHICSHHRNEQGASSAVYTEPPYLKVLLDQGLSYVNEQSQLYAVRSTSEASPSVLQTQDKIEQSQMCVAKNTEGSPPVQQTQDTTEQSQVCAMKNTEGRHPVLQAQDTIEQSQMCVAKNTEGRPPVLQAQDTIEQSQMCAAKNTTEGGSPVLQ